MFLDFKKWVKIIQTAGYNGARTVVWQSNMRQTLNFCQTIQEGIKCTKSKELLHCEKISP